MPGSAKTPEPRGLEISLEITPPKRPAPKLLRRRAGMLGAQVSSVHVIQRPDRMSSLDACVELAAQGSTPTWHLVCRGRRPEDLLAEIDLARSAAIDRVLVIRGDHRPVDSISGPRIREVVAWIREFHSRAQVAVTFNQYAPHTAALRNLAGKLRAGAVRVQTQPVFDFEVYRSAAERVRALDPALQLQPMLIPLVDPTEVERLRERLGLPIPWEISRRLAEGGAEAGWRAFVDQARRLRQSGLADALAIMTLAVDPPEPYQERLRAAFDEVLA